MNRFPALRKAFTSMQSTFDDEAEPTDDDLAFITRVRGAAAANLGASPTKWPMVDHLLSRTNRCQMKTPPKPPSPI